ncbi:hypothetical protein Scep_007099 [Stephania cephalantha]|uniref:Cytochrome P450 n=1 Tax=Stephania cephalantha TaxID=152367 RepID=A0AAP0PLG3_9MAGN
MAYPKLTLHPRSSIHMPRIGYRDGSERSEWYTVERLLRKYASIYGIKIFVFTTPMKTVIQCQIFHHSLNDNPTWVTTIDRALREGIMNRGKENETWSKERTLSRESFDRDRAPRKEIKEVAGVTLLWKRSGWLDKWAIGVVV